MGRERLSPYVFMYFDDRRWYNAFINILAYYFVEYECRESD